MARWSLSGRGRCAGPRTSRRQRRIGQRASAAAGGRWQLPVGRGRGGAWRAAAAAGRVRRGAGIMNSCSTLHIARYAHTEERCPFTLHSRVVYTCTRTGHDGSHSRTLTLRILPIAISICIQFCILAGACTSINTANRKDHGKRLRLRPTTSRQNRAVGRI